jgi:hypothetical protein
MAHGSHRRNGDEMTHDELLAKLSNDENGYARSTPSQRISALRAVVELHKPIEGHEHLCSSCMFGDFMQVYPCLTIQVIEKELA